MKVVIKIWYTIFYDRYLVFQGGIWFLIVAWFGCLIVLVGFWDAYRYLDWGLLLVSYQSGSPGWLAKMARVGLTNIASSLDSPAQTTSLQSTLPRSSPTPPQTTLARSATSLPRHTTVTLAISHFYMLEADYLLDRD